MSVAVAVAIGTVTGLLLTVGSHGHIEMVAQAVVPRATVPRPALTTVGQAIDGPVSSINFQGVPGALDIVGTGSGQVTVTGQVRGGRGTPVVVSRLDRASGVLTLSVQCAPTTQCTQNLRLTVPGDTSVNVWQPSGQIVAADLAGALRINATKADVSATGLRADLAAVIVSGHLSATFVTPPRQVSIALVSAQATLHLPAGGAYRVNQQVTSGYVRNAIPQTSGATSTVTARVDSGELELLPS